MSLVLLVTGLRTGRAVAASGGAVPAVASGALAAGLVGAAAFLGLLGVVVACWAFGLAVLLFL
ncbi:hypothetical protein ACUN7V_10970 [Quadrisphaera oryzae]|uniref:hypothetical protein n=1 Tax=Quadrisphaera TaxID=317661 RepID=UPI0016481396|nr:hypothetical protein [Quadrisphaera sp. RL12-1S]MBC3762175.1 hypothetical protein [Quadrisphaera sp. RL12-1S]